MLARFKNKQYDEGLLDGLLHPRHDDGESRRPGQPASGAGSTDSDASNPLPGPLDQTRSPTAHHASGHTYGAACLGPGSANRHLALPAQACSSWCFSFERPAASAAGAMANLRVPRVGAPTMAAGVSDADSWAVSLVGFSAVGSRTGGRSPVDVLITMRSIRAAADSWTIRPVLPASGAILAGLQAEAATSAEEAVGISAEAAISEEPAAAAGISSVMSLTVLYNECRS